MRFQLIHKLQRSCRTVLVCLTVCAGGNTVAQADPWRLTIVPGAGHDRFTETFFIEDSLAINPDSLETIRKTEDGLRESYGSLGLIADNGPIRIETSTYATSAAWRNLSRAEGRWRSGRWKTRVTGQWEWKGIDPDDSLASAYTFMRLHARPQFHLGGPWTALLRADWERADYTRGSSYATDYSRLRGQLGIQFLSDRLESLDAYAGVTRRHVPDSAILKYTETFLRIAAYGWSLHNWNVGADFSVADRTFNESDGSDDVLRWWISLRTNRYLTETWYLSSWTEWSIWDYRQDDDINYDISTWRLAARILAQMEGGLELGTQLEWRTETTSGSSISSGDYGQWSFGPIITWSPGVVLWTEFSPRIGRRNYASGSAIYDDYDFQELSFQADILLPAGPNAGVTLTYLNEDHSDSSRDLDQIYISVAVRFPFEP